jgi:hypothetical protein
VRAEGDAAVQWCRAVRERFERRGQALALGSGVERGQAGAERGSPSESARLTFV